MNHNTTSLEISQDSRGRFRRRNNSLGSRAHIEMINGMVGCVVLWGVNPQTVL